VWLSRKTDAVVVPCAIYGTSKIMPPKTWIPRRGLIKIGFAPPVDVSAAAYPDPSDAAEEVRSRTARLLEDLAG
jgi:1-acyl-sn-glycerol-3-phosphate acyltransferase